MTVKERCTYCDTPLVIVGDDGAAHRFTGHDLEFCRTATYGRVCALTAALKMAHDQIAQLGYEYGKLVGECRDATPLRVTLRNLVGVARAGEGRTEGGLRSLIGEVEAEVLGALERDERDQQREMVHTPDCAITRVWKAMSAPKAAEFAASDAPAEALAPCTCGLVK